MDADLTKTCTSSGVGKIKETKTIIFGINPVKVDTYKPLSFG
jgi:hypothetical protein